jgi:hypothetical protein
MLQDLTIILKDRPGALALVGESLGKAGVNIEGICGVSFDNMAIIHILVQDVDKARKILKAKKISVSGGLEVLVLDVEDRPGTLGTITHQLAEAGINIHLIYQATATRLVISVNDMEKARSILQQ